MMNQFLTCTILLHNSFETGKGYPIYSRKKSLDAAEEIMFDCNELAEGTNILN
jgi:oligopeptidase B